MTDVNLSAEAREARTFAALLETARSRQQETLDRSPVTPRFLIEGAQSMAEHMGLSEQQAQAHLRQMGLWQLYMPSAMGAETWDFPAVREHMPWSYGRIHDALAAVESRPQVVVALFHMASFATLSTLVGAAWRDLHDGPLHLLIAARNAGWLGMGKNSWVKGAVEVVTTYPSGLRQLMGGLKDGSIKRLLILADGPQAPGQAGVRALDNISPSLGMRTTLLSKFHAMGIPLVPITHEWEDDRLVVTPRPVLDPDTLSEAETLDAVAAHIEDLLRRHPEQWQNWGAAKIRT